MLAKKSIQRSFRDLLIYRIASTISYQMMMVAVGWHIFDITHDVVSLGLIGLAELVPFFAFAFYAGHIVDYHSRKLIATISCSIHIVVGCFLMWIANATLPSSEIYIYIGVAFLGIARALLRPSFQSLFGELIPREQTPKYSAYASSAYQLSIVGGPAIAGICIGLIGLSPTYLISGLVCILGIYAITLIQEKEHESHEHKNQFFSSLKFGLNYVKNHDLLLTTMVLDMLAVLFGGVVAILPAFVKEVLNGGPEVLGILRATPAIGSVMTAFYLARNPILKNSGKYMLAAVVGFGVAMIAFSLSTSLFWSALFLMFSGFFDTISVVVRSAVFQLTTPHQIRGRISAINGIFVGSSNELGALESGLAASLMGLIPSIAFGGAVTILVAGVSYFVAPTLRKMHLKDLMRQQDHFK